MEIEVWKNKEKWKTYSMEFLLTSHTELLSNCEKTQLCMGHIFILSFLLFLWSVSKYKTCNWAKIGFYPFQPNFPKNASCLKLLWDIHLFWNSIFKKIEFQWKFQFGENQVVWKNLHFLEWNLNPMQVFFFLIAYNLIFAK